MRCLYIFVFVILEICFFIGIGLTLIAWAALSLHITNTFSWVGVIIIIASIGCLIILGQLDRMFDISEYVPPRRRIYSPTDLQWSSTETKDWNMPNMPDHPAKKDPIAEWAQAHDRVEKEAQRLVDRNVDHHDWQWSGKKDTPQYREQWKKDIHDQYYDN